MQRVTAQEEYERDKFLRKEDISELSSWKETQTLLPRIIREEELIQFLKGVDYSIEKAKKVISDHYRIRRLLPEVFSNRDPHNEGLQKIWQLVDIWVSPRTTPEGWRILFNGLHCSDTDRFDLNEATKAYFMVLEANLLEYGSCAGYILVTDFNGTSLGHMLKCRMMAIKRICEYAQDGLQIKVIGIHGINIGTMAYTIINIAKPFLSGELMAIARFYPVSTLQENKFYDAVPRQVLPIDLGGVLPPRAELREESKACLSRLRDWFLAEERNELDRV